MARFQRHTVLWCRRSSSRAGTPPAPAAPGAVPRRAPAAPARAAARSPPAAPAAPVAPPAGPEGDPADPAAGPAGGVAVVHRLLEQRHPGLLPEPVAEEGGGVAGDGQHRAGGQLGGVVVGREPVGVDPQVDLEGGVGALQADVVGGQLQRVGPVDPDPERLPAQPADAVVERPVAGRVREGRQPEVLGAQGGQDADHRHPAAVPAAARRTMPRAWSSSLAKAAKGRPASGAGVRFSSRLKRSTSRTTRGSAASSRTTWFSGRARPWPSTRNSSSSAPTVAGPVPKPGRSSRRPRAARQSSRRRSNRR